MQNSLLKKTPAHLAKDLLVRIPPLFACFARLETFPGILVQKQKQFRPNTEKYTAWDVVFVCIAPFSRSLRSSFCSEGMENYTFLLFFSGSSLKAPGTRGDLPRNNFETIFNRFSSLFSNEKWLGIFFFSLGFWNLVAYQADRKWFWVCAPR